MGLETRLDGLYFALTTLATVGYGDVHAQGQFARAVVSFQLLFNVVVVTTAASVLVGELRTRAASRSAGKQQVQVAELVPQVAGGDRLLVAAASRSSPTIASSISRWDARGSWKPVSSPSMTRTASRAE